MVRKFIVSVVFWLVVFLASSATTAAASVLSDDNQTIGLWHMEDLLDDDSYIIDRNHDLSLPGGSYSTPTIVAGGQYGNALSFDGDGLARVNAWDGHDSVKIDLWANINMLNTTANPNVTTTDEQYLVWNKGTFMLYYKGLQSDLVFKIENGNGSYMGHVQFDVQQFDLDWIHVVATYTNDLGISLTVTDGVTELSGTSTANAPGMATVTADDYIHLGGKDTNTGTCLDGMLDEVKITVPSFPDTAAPTPNPATFSIAPSADSFSAISMTATTGTDATGPVEYYFDETSGNPGGTDSGWQTSPSYTDSGLDPNTQYSYTVQMRDAILPTPNVGSASSPASATIAASTMEQHLSEISFK
jgi:hypothetical protein